VKNKKCTNYLTKNLTKNHARKSKKGLVEAAAKPIRKRWHGFIQYLLVKLFGN